jgi:single-stranded-DNA-specific exonuclease
VLAFAAAEGWHPGEIGIAAARLKERYQRPACVVAVADGIGRGSGRSVAGLALGPAVIAARQAGLLINGGGHAMAAGFTVAAERIEALRDYLAERLGDGLDREALVPELVLDGRLALGAATSDLTRHVAALAPFGAANPEPRFAFAPVRVLHAEPVGGAHLRCTLADPLGDARLRAIAFRVTESPLGRFLAETRGAAIQVSGRLRRDSWRGGDAVELVIDDAAPAPLC